MKIKIYIIFLTAIFGMISAEQLNAQGGVVESRHKVYSIYLYNFTKYIQWPDSNKSGDFIIGILGDTGMENEIKAMAKKKNVNGRKINVTNYASVDEIKENCNILVIANSSSNLLSDVLKATANQPTLIVTNKDGLGRYGSLINFVTQNDKPTFELNLSAFEKRDLNLAQQLKTIGIVL